MSAAEPAMPTPPPTPASDDATVIPFQERRHAHGAANPASDRRRTMTTADPGNPTEPPPDRPAVLLLLANDLEESFNSIGRTLTDDDTAEAVQHTLSLVIETLHGASARGIVTDEQRQELVVLVGGMRDALRLV